MSWNRRAAGKNRTDTGKCGQLNYELFVNRKERFKKNLNGMKRDPARPVFDLMPATGTRCGNQGLGITFSDFRKKHEFADFHRKIKMLFFVSK